MIGIQDAIRIHDIIIDKFGGASGIRDLNLLESAINRPFQTFDKKDLYPGVIEKASALIESTLNNHPFIDGNKRTKPHPDPSSLRYGRTGKDSGL